MSFLNRNILDLIRLSEKSCLLLGPRQTGKSTLLNQLDADLEINLADEAEFLSFAANPKLIHQRIAHLAHGTIFIDEVQRLPSLLNTLQSIIDKNKNLRFLLTGSSARKLRRGQANLLPGRIHTYSLGPLVSSELGYALDEEAALSFGTLPGIYTESETTERKKTLRSYTATYLKEEIQAEALTKNIEGFARFLHVAASAATQFLDIKKLSDQALINPQTTRRYFEILEDTLIVHRLPSFAKSARKRLIQHPKYFFFDNGVLNALLGSFAISADRKGMLFEHLFVTQVLHSLAARDEFEYRLSNYRTEHGAEVDLILERHDDVLAIEIKASNNVGKFDLTGLKSFADFHGKNIRQIVAYLGDERRQIDDVEIWPWQKLLKELRL